MNQSIIEHKPNMYYVEFREDYLSLCQNCTYKKPVADGKKSKASAYCKALILAILEHWTNDKRGKGAGLCVFMTHQQWSAAMYGMFGRCVIIDSLDELIGEGLIKRAPYKMFGRDTFQYLLNYQEVNRRMRALPERDPSVTEPQVDVSTRRRDPSKSRRVASKSRRVASTSRHDPSISSDNIYSPYIHLDSSENQGGVVPSSCESKDTDTRPQSTHPLVLSQEEKECVKETEGGPPRVSSSPLAVKEKEEEELLLDLWDTITGCKNTRPRWVVDAARELVRIGATSEQMKLLYTDLLKNPPKKGINLETIMNEWRRLPTLTREATAASSSSPQLGAPREMDELSKRNAAQLLARVAAMNGASSTVVAPPPPPPPHEKGSSPHYDQYQQQPPQQPPPAKSTWVTSTT